MAQHCLFCKRPVRKRALLCLWCHNVRCCHRWLRQRQESQRRNPQFWKEEAKTCT